MNLFINELAGETVIDIESFSSFIARSAFAYSMPAGIMLTRVCEIAAQEGFLKDIPSIASYSYGRLTKGRTIVLQIIKYFESITGNNFRQGTSWSIDSYFSTPHSEFSTMMRWCPECFKEMQMSGTDPYAKMIWSMTSIKYCPKHKTLLLDECPRCQFKLTRYSLKYALDKCQNCEADLSQRNQLELSSDLEYSWENSGGDIIKFIIHSAGQSYGDELANCSYESLRKLMLRVAVHARSIEYANFSNQLIIDVRQALKQADDNRKISLNVARRIAHLEQVSLYAFATGTLDQLAGNLDLSWHSELPSEIRVVPRELKQDYWELLARIQRYLSKTDTPPNLAKVANHFGVSVGKLEYRYAGLVKEITRRRKIYLADKRFRRHLECKKMAYRYFFDERFSDYPKSRKKACAYIREKTGWPKFFVRDIVQEIYEQYTFR